MKRAVIGTALAALALRMALLTGVGAALQNWSQELASDGRLVRATLSFELGTERPAVQEAAIEEPQALEKVSVIHTVRVNVEPLLPEMRDTLPEVKTPEFSQSVSIKNDTSFWVDTQTISPGELTQRFSSAGPQILIIHTHSSEAYTQDPLDMYVESDSYRTEEESHSVIRVGDELTEVLESYGLSVIHDRNVYDYPNYTGAYVRSGEAIEGYLAQYPDIAMVIDLHRDAIGSGDNIYKTRAQQQGDCAQIMMLIGTGENGLYHPQWRENLKLAVYLQSAVDAAYPSLMRPIALKQERYNQQLTTGSMILEVGSTGNTLEEVLRAIRLYGDAVGPALRLLMDV